MLSLGGSGYVATPVVQPSITAATYVAWILTGTTQSEAGILSGRQNGNTLDGNLTLCVGGFYDGKTGAIDWGLDSSGQAVSVWTDVTFNDGLLHCVVATMSGVSGATVAPAAFAIYVDGAAQAVSSATVGTVTFPIAGTNSVGIGELGGSASWVGQLAHAVILYGTVVTAARAQAIYENGLTMTVADYEAYLQSLAPTDYWPLQETTGTTAANLGSAGSADDGTYTGTYTLGAFGGPPVPTIVGTSPAAGASVAVTSCTAYQNTSGADAVVLLPVTYNPTSAAAATLAVGIGRTSAPTQTLTESIPAGAVVGSLRTGVYYVPANWYRLVTATNATLGTASVQPV